MTLPIGGSSAPPNLPHGTIWVDVRDYGAKADDYVTDNSIPFQAAVDALAAKLAGRSNKGVVYIPNATKSYGVRNSVWVDSDNIEIHGDGWGSAVLAVGSNQPVFIFGVPRVQSYSNNGTTVTLQANATNRPDLYGKLDASVVSGPGSMWGLRTNGNSFAQFHGTPLSAGAGTAANSLYSDQFGETSQLTIEFCVEPPDSQKFPGQTPLFGCGEPAAQASPFLVWVGDPNTLSVFFRTSDIENDIEYLFRGFNFSIAGATAPYRVAVQLDMVNAVCTAFVNGSQVALTGQINLGPTDAIPFTPGAGLTLVKNDYFPFMLGTHGARGNYGSPTGIDLRVYGLRLSNTIRYQNNGAGRPQVRTDAPTTAVNDAWAYFGNDAHTICWLQGHDNPATAGRVVSVQHGNATAGGTSTGLLIHSLPQLQYNYGNGLRNISLSLGNAHGQTVCVGAVYELTFENVMAVGGYQGIGSFNCGANYYIHLRNCILDGADAGYYGMMQLVIASDVQFLTAGRATIRMAGSCADFRGVFVIRSTPVCDHIFKANSYGYGGNYTITNLLVDFEGNPIGRAAIFCEAHPYVPATSLVLKDIYFGSIGSTASLVMLKDMIGSNAEAYGFSKCWVSIENMQAYANDYEYAIDVDGPLWHGEMKGVALRNAPFNHRQKWGTTTNVLTRETKFVGPPRAFPWYYGAHALEVRSPADGQFAEWRCVGSGAYGTPAPPAWLGLNPLNITTNGLAAYVLNHYYITAALH